MKLHPSTQPVLTEDLSPDEAMLVTVETSDAMHEPAPLSDATPVAQAVSPLRPANAATPQGASRMVQAVEIATIEALSAQQALISFRTLQAFSYSANLLFHHTALSYYITLSQDGRLWRALHADDFESAEAAFRSFEEQAVRLADAELRRAYLEAQNRQFAAAIEASEALAERLRNDLESHAAQTQLVTTRQQHLRKEVAQLEMQRAGAKAHLNKTSRQIHQLRAASNELVPHLTKRRAES
ncbi:DUF2968 domain-containing protein [Burkholderia pyrrocinia]|uniref:DUF2968 domain-containing protein n=1 Tax=Burkholderia pyrrocinia TaxID=60550 RepID=UPI001BCBE389|nr:DUF2968 domain-containing protein [Burkholderia pyrrocinia]QVN21302.1 DUF2968 domain-containing protein [Burkholderia pyrrocinia]